MTRMRSVSGLTTARGGCADMGWFSGDSDAVEEHKAALDDINDYIEHQREQNPRMFEPGGGTVEHKRLYDRVAEAEKHVPWWRR